MTAISECERVYARGALLAVTERQDLLTNIVLGKQGTLTCQTQEWSTYWQSVDELKVRDVSAALSNLRFVWHKYIKSGFMQEMQREYCFRYHVLLDSVINLQRKAPGPSSRKALQKCLAFECFGIHLAEEPYELLTAATTSLRNPNYLLAKVKYPNALDDVRYLPLVTMESGNDMSLFYHYRQHRLSLDSQASLLLYLPVEMDVRAMGFYCMSQLENLLGEGKDARVNERAQRLVGKVMVPFLETRTQSHSCTPIGLELLDLGAGSGALAAAICKRTYCHFQHVGKDVGFKARLIDLVLPKVQCFWSSRALADSTDFVYAAKRDSQGWVAQLTTRTAELLPLAEGAIRVGLVSQLFNNLSDFRIQPLRMENRLPSEASPDTLSAWRNCLPTRCLGAIQAGPDSLRISSAPLRFSEGRTFRQPSLSEYFRAITLVSAAQREMERNVPFPEEVFAPFRQFRPECLETNNGASILRTLLAVCSLVLVFDADLRPDDLKRHFGTAGIEGIEAVDMTKPLRLKGNYCYALVKANEAGATGLAGERLW